MISQTDSATLALRAEFISFFVRLAESFGLPRTVGEICGYIYASPEAVSFESIGEELKISKGSVSQGLKLLRSLHAIRATYHPGDRRSYFEPEMSLRRLTATLIDHTVMPQLREAAAHLEHMQQLVKDDADTIDETLTLRVAKLSQWQSRSRRMLSLLKRVLSVSS